jgi:acyl-CoA thioester hydrolase
MGISAFPELSLGLSVRDYECDLQGIVNHAVYLNYLEHARHEYLKAIGLSFTELSRRNHFLVVARADVSYKRSLVSGDEFIVVSRLTLPKRFRGLFYQRIERASDRTLMIEAQMTIAYLVEGKLAVFSGLFPEM